MRHLSSGPARLTRKRVVFFFSIFLTACFLAPAFLAGTAAAAATKMKHSAPDYFVPEERIKMEAQVTDPSGVKVVRCYFKAAGEADLVFVPMTLAGKNMYTAVLPAPSASTTQIDYLFLSVNNNNEVVKSQNFAVMKNAAKGVPDWQAVPKEGEIKVSMELDNAPKELRGFSDNVTIDVVESSARFGVVAYLYHELMDDGSHGGASQSGSGVAVGAEGGVTASAAAATGATSAGTITASTLGWSTAAIVGLGVGAAAVAGGTVAVIENNNDDSSSGGGGGGKIKCDEVAQSGGDEAATYTVNLGQNSGTFDFSYNHQWIPDRMIVTYEGAVLYDTGCVGTDDVVQTQEITYSGNSEKVTVTVEPNCDGTTTGTWWTFTVGCPK